VIEIKVDTVDLTRFANKLEALGENAPLAIGRALNHTGAKARTAMIRSLTKQTGLKRKVIVRALKVNPVKYGNPKIGRLDARSSYIIESRGGNISLKYFDAREVRKGVSAKPWGKRRLYPGTFIRGGLHPNRVGISKLGGHVFRNVEGGKWRGKIEKVKSNLTIPEEMVQGATEAAFFQVVQSDLPKRLEHEMDILMQIEGLL